MSEENNTTEQQEETAKADGAVLKGVYAFKKGMSSVYNEKGDAVPVTVLSYEPWVVTQIKSKDKEGYEAIQISCRPTKGKNAKKANATHMKAAGFENGAKMTREIRQDLPEGVKVGDKVSLDSLAKGDTVRLTSNSKGRGFSGVMKRWGFGGGPASHGSGFHRRPGSIGNCTFPGRVMPGRKMPGHFGDAKVTVKNVEVVEVLKDENVVLVKGPVPGSTNSIVKLMKV